MALNSGKPLGHAKKGTDGLLERLHILQNHDGRAGELVAESLLRYRRSEVAEDDILDAMAAAVVASKFPALTTVPERPELDDRGLPMEMVIPSSGET